VELYAEPADGAASEVIALSHDGSVPGATSGFIYRGQLRGARSESDYTARVVPVRQGVRVPAETALIRWQR
jgi:starch phosphorylase